MKEIPISQENEFLDFLNAKINRADYRNKYLVKTLDGIFGRGEIPITPDTIVITENDDWILYIQTNGQLFLYGAYNEALLQKLATRITLQNLRNYQIMGKYELVYKLFDIQSIKEFVVIKDRYFYQLNDTSMLLPSLSNTKTEPGDLNELTQMMLKYYEEEYQGERNKTEAQILPVIKKHIDSQSIWVFRENNTIKSFCTIINPDIGIIYTSSDFREQGIAKRLLSTCSRILFELNNVSYLMTDYSNEASNKLCRDIGYEMFYKHSYIKM